MIQLESWMIQKDTFIKQPESSSQVNKNQKINQLERFIIQLILPLTYSFTNIDVFIKKSSSRYVKLFLISNNLILLFSIIISYSGYYNTYYSMYK